MHAYSRIFGGSQMWIVVFSFLLAKEKGTSRPVAFVSYRYDIEEGDEVVYWYVSELVLFTHVPTNCRYALM